MTIKLGDANYFPFKPVWQRTAIWEGWQRNAPEMTVSEYRGWCDDNQRFFDFVNKAKATDEH